MFDCMYIMFACAVVWVCVRVCAYMHKYHWHWYSSVYDIIEWLVCYAMRTTFQSKPQNKKKLFWNEHKTTQLITAIKSLE